RASAGSSSTRRRTPSTAACGPTPPRSSASPTRRRPDHDRRPRRNPRLRTADLPTLDLNRNGAAHRAGRTAPARPWRPGCAPGRPPPPGSLNAPRGEIAMRVSPHKALAVLLAACPAVVFVRCPAEPNGPPGAGSGEAAQPNEVAEAVDVRSVARAQLAG